MADLISMFMFTTCFYRFHDCFSRHADNFFETTLCSHFFFAFIPLVTAHDVTFSAKPVSSDLKISEARLANTLSAFSRTNESLLVLYAMLCSVHAASNLFISFCPSDSHFFNSFLVYKTDNHQVSVIQRVGYLLTFRRGDIK